MSAGQWVGFAGLAGYSLYLAVVMMVSDVEVPAWDE